MERCCIYRIIDGESRLRGAAEYWRQTRGDGRAQGSGTVWRHGGVDGRPGKGSSSQSTHWRGVGGRWKRRLPVRAHKALSLEFARKPTTGVAGAQGPVLLLYHLC